MKKSTIILLTTLVILIIIKTLKIQNPINILTNEYLIIGYQATKECKADTNIAIVNIRDFPTDVIRDQIEILSLYEPAVIVVDYFPEDCFFSDSTTLVNFSNMILPSDVESGKVQKSINCYSNSAYYGFINFYSTSFFEPLLDVNGSTHQFVGVKALELFDQIQYQKVIDRGTDKEIINYTGNYNRFLFLGDLLNTQPADLEVVKGKIVLLGYTGLDSIPMPNSLSDYDVHETPLGLMYGVVIIANAIHTLRGDMITPIAIFWNILIILALIAICIAIPFGLLKITFSYPLIKAFQVITIALLFIQASYVLHRFNSLIDVEAFYWAILLAPELTYWAFKNNSKN